MSLKSKEQKIYEILKNRELYRNEKGIFTMCPQKLLIRLSGKGESTVRRILKNIEEQGYIRRELDTKIHIMLFYFLKEDFSGRDIHNRYENHENEPVSIGDTEKMSPSTQSVQKNEPVSIGDTEKMSPSTQSIQKNEPVSIGDTEKTSPSTQSVQKNEPVSIGDTEKMSATTQKVAENEHHSDENIASIKCENAVVSTVREENKPQKNQTVALLELSAVKAERMFYVLPTGPANHFMFDILASGKDIANLPARKKQVNHGTKYDVKANGDRRRVTMENRQGTSVTVELENINRLNDAGKKFLTLSMIKANEQCLSNGELTRDYVSFPLEELIDCGCYTNENSAREGFKAGTSALTSIKIRGIVTKTKKRTQTIHSLEVPFTGATIKNNQCFIYLNNRINWSFFTQYFTQIPPYYFKLSSRASDLLYYIFYLARQHTGEIAQKGYFTVSFRSIHSLLQLPDPEVTKNPQRDIKEAIENAVTEIETEHSNAYGNKELSFALVYNENAGILDYMDNGYMKISITGQFAEFFIEQRNIKDYKTDRDEKKQARIEEKAKAMNLAELMKHIKNGNS